MSPTALTVFPPAVTPSRARDCGAGNECLTLSRWRAEWRICRSPGCGPQVDSRLQPWGSTSHCTLSPLHHRGSLSLFPLSAPLFTFSLVFAISSHYRQALHHSYLAGMNLSPRSLVERHDFLQMNLISHVMLQVGWSPLQSFLELPRGHDKVMRPPAGPAFWGPSVVGPWWPLQWWLLSLTWSYQILVLSAGFYASLTE